MILNPNDAENLRIRQQSVFFSRLFLPQQNWGKTQIRREHIFFSDGKEKSIETKYQRNDEIY
jgi:hypothetical protein